MGMEFARPLREVFADLAGHDADPQSLLAEHADLPADLLTTAIGSYASTAPAEVAEHLAPFVAGGEAAGADPVDGLNLLVSAPAGTWQGEVDLDHSAVIEHPDDFPDTLHDADPLHDIDGLHDSDGLHDVGALHDGDGLHDVGDLHDVGGLNSADSLDHVDQADHTLADQTVADHEQPAQHLPAGVDSAIDGGDQHFGEPSRPALAEALTDGDLDDTGDGAGAGDEHDVSQHFAEIPLDSSETGLEHLDHLTDDQDDSHSLGTEHHLDDAGHDDPGHDDSGHDLDGLDHFHG
jgi:hypothetical protein